MIARVCTNIGSDHVRTDDKLEEICTALTLHHGDVHEAARYAGVSPMFILRWRKEDREAAERMEEAQNVGWLGLESEARRRAVDGVEEEVYYRGEVVGKKVNYSDTLLGKLLEARVPAFNKREASNVFSGPTQINIMPRAESYEDWLGMKQATLEARDDAPQLAGPGATIPEVLQGVFVEAGEREVTKGLEDLKDLGL